MKMTVTLPQLPPSCQQQSERINHLRRHTKLLLSMKESRHEVLSEKKPDIIFDAPVDGFHATLHRTVDNHLLLSDLESLSSTSDTVIGIRITSSNFLPRFSIPSSTFSNLVTSLERRFSDLASNHSLWGSELNAVTKLERPLVLTDKEFLANYVLIGNIDPSALSNQISTASLQNMIRKVVSHSLPGCKVDEEFFFATFNEKVRHLRPNNLGIEESKAVRTLMVIKLNTPVRAGTTLGGGTRIYQRICGTEESQPGAIYLTRQFLSDWEAKHMLASIATPTDSIIVMARHLTKRTELEHSRNP